MRLHRSVARALQYWLFFEFGPGRPGSDMTISALAAGVAVAGLAIQTFSYGPGRLPVPKGRLASPRARRGAAGELGAAALRRRSLFQGNARFDIRARLPRLRNPVLPRRSGRSDRAGGAPRHGREPADPFAAADRRRSRQRQSQAQQYGEGLEGGGPPVGDRRRFQRAHAARLHPAPDGALARRHRHRLRAADRVAARTRSPPRSNARS